MGQLRICIVTAFPPTRGRLSEYAKALIDELAKNGEVERIDVIANRVGKKRNTMTYNNGKVVVWRVWGVNDILSPLKALLKVIELRPQIIHFNVHLASFGRGRVVNFAWSLLIPLLALFRVKTVVTLHNLHERIKIEETGLKDSVLNRLGLMLATKFYTFASSVIVTMKSYVEIVKKRYRKQAFHIPHGASLFNNPPNPGSCNPSLSGSSKNLLFLGYLGPYKDVCLLLEAFRRVRTKKTWVKLLFSGSVHPNYPEMIKKVEGFQNESDVVYLGYTPNEKLPEILEEVSVIALPYTTCTGTSGVVHLLACFGKPMVVTDLPEFRELRNEGAGVMLVDRDSEAFSEAIIRLMEDEGLRATLGKINLAFAQGRTWDRVAQAYVKLYKATMSP